MLNREFKIIEETKGKKELKIYFSDKKYEQLSDVFDAEISGFADWIKEEIYSVLSGKCDKKEIIGNQYGIVIKKDKTMFFDAIDDECEDESFCTLDTEELVEIIKEWQEQQNILKEENIKKEKIKMKVFFLLCIIFAVLGLIGAFMIIYKIVNNVLYVVIAILSIITGMFYGYRKKKS